MTGGGETSHLLGGHERVAGEDDGDVVVPAGEGAALEVVEPELALEVLVRAFGSPPLLQGRNQLFATDVLGQRRERVAVGASRDASRPLRRRFCEYRGHVHGGLEHM